MVGDEVASSIGHDQCDLPTTTLTVSPAPAAVGRYVAFTAKGFYGYAVAINHVSLTTIC